MDKSNLYALPLGTDYARNFVNKFCNDITDPLERTKALIFVNTERTKRRLIELFTTLGPSFLPQIYSFTELGNDPFYVSDSIDAPDPIHTRLTLAELIAGLLDARPDLAPKSSIYDLAESLQNLMAEVHGEGVSLQTLTDLDLSHHADQWAVSKVFLKILSQYEQDMELSSPAARYHQVLDGLTEYWNDAPPEHPVFVVGSTGSRNESLRLMVLVLSLPKGVVLLPGVDPKLVEEWDLFSDDTPHLDHPQGVLAKTIRKLGHTPKSLKFLGSSDPHPRNDLLSLSLIPAPVTDRWLQEGKTLGATLGEATEGLALLEAEDMRQEAMSIAAILREAAEKKQTAALVTPDRNLTRRVAAQLDRWGILPDDSAGQPLQLTPEGIFLRLIARGLDGPIQPQTLLALLTHKLTQKDDNRAAHSLMVQKFDLGFLRDPNPRLDKESLLEWADPMGAEAIVWVSWLSEVLAAFEDKATQSLSSWVERLLRIAEILSFDSTGQGCDFWGSDAGQRIEQHIQSLRAAPYTQRISGFDFSKLLNNVLRDELPLPAHLAHPHISIWGTLEARVQGADLVILGGLNEGIWPAADDPDIWLNRDMRKQLGLLPPERLIGLSAHDYEQTAMAQSVVFSRAKRSDDAQTTPARWLSRLTHLLGGLEDAGRSALQDMKDRAAPYLEISNWLDHPKDLEVKPPATRPAPVLPSDVRLENLSVTEVKTLVKDPYDIYAKRILNLRKVDPIGRQADARDRGTAIHAITEQFSKTDQPWSPDNLKLNGAYKRFVDVMDSVLEDFAPTATLRLTWRAGVLRVLEWFLEDEAERRKLGASAAIEKLGEITFPDLGLSLRTRADRIDKGPDGYRIYDYKGGNPPSKTVIKRGDKQLSLMALILRAGGFDDLPPDEIAHLEFIGFHPSQSKQLVDTLDNSALDQIEDAFKNLVMHYQNGGGFVARDRPITSDNIQSNYEHLSRFGEWTDADSPNHEDMS